MKVNYIENLTICIKTRNLKTLRKRDIQFVLFKLKLLNVDVDSGIETVNNISNSLQKVLDVLTGKNIERSLIINILEIALDEKIEEV